MGIHLKSVLAKGLMGATLAFALVGCGSKSEPQAATEDVVQETWPYAEAMEYMNKHLYARAIQSVTTAMEQTGETAEGLTIRGVAHAKLNHPADAFRDLIEVTKIDYSATSLFNLGNALRSLGYCARAIDAYEHALALDANNPAIHVNPVSSHLCLNEVVKANDYFVQAIPNLPKDAIAYTNAGVLKMLDDKTDEALAAARTAIKYDASYRPAYKILSQALMTMGDSTGAKDAMNTYKQLKGATMRNTRFIPEERQHKPATATTTK